MPVTERSYILSFLQYLRFEKRYSPHTITAYQGDLAGFFEYLDSHFNERELDRVDHNMIRSWLATLKAGGLSARAINRKISTLKSFFRFHLKAGAVSATPMAKVIRPKTGRRLPEFVKEEDAALLLQRLASGTEDWQGWNARLLITIFYATGMRLSELINLRERQVDHHRSQVKVLGKGNKERVIPLPGEVLALVDAYQAEKRRRFADPGETLLVTEKGRKLYPRYAWTLVNRYLGESSSLSKKSPHVLRHTFATHLMNNGADLNAVKELLGHSSLGTTQIYTHNTIEKLKDIHKKAHPKS